MFTKKNFRSLLFVKFGADCGKNAVIRSRIFWPAGRFSANVAVKDAKKAKIREQVK
jgi:hypothetical protein